MSRAGRAAGLVAVLATLGCGGDPPKATGTGAREAAQRYFLALVHDDPSVPYALLAAESRGRVGPAEFGRLVASYRRSLGFKPETVIVNACEERGTEAIAHVTLSEKGAHRHRFKDAVSLRREAAGWVVVLSSSFGRTPKG